MRRPLKKSGDFFGFFAGNIQKKGPFQRGAFYVKGVRCSLFLVWINDLLGSNDCALDGTTRGSGDRALQHLNDSVLCLFKKAGCGRNAAAS